MDNTNKMKKTWEKKKVGASILCLVLAISAIVILFGMVIPLHSKAGEYGERMGTQMGAMAGYASGVISGITEGREAGEEAGTQQGLSAEDTTIDITGLRNTGRLNVMFVNTKYEVYNQTGKYCYLYIYPGTATYSVDLSAANVEMKGNEITIQVPTPEVDISINVADCQEIAKWGSDSKIDAKDMVAGYLNSLSEIQNGTSTNFVNHEVLMEQAKELARSQIVNLADKASINSNLIHVEFAD